MNVICYCFNGDVVNLYSKQKKKLTDTGYIYNEHWVDLFRSHKGLVNPALVLSSTSFGDQFGKRDIVIEKSKKYFAGSSDKADSLVKL